MNSPGVGGPAQCVSSRLRFVVLLAVGVGAVGASVGMLVSAVAVRLFADDLPPGWRLAVVALGSVAVAGAAGWFGPPAVTRLADRLYHRLGIGSTTTVKESRKSNVE